MWWRRRPSRMKVRLQIPPSIDADLEVVAPNQREDLVVYVLAGDGSRWEFRFRWTGVDQTAHGDSIPLVLLQQIVLIAPPRDSPLQRLDGMLHRQLPEGS